MKEPKTVLLIIYACVGNKQSSIEYDLVETKGRRRLGVTMIEEVKWSEAPEDWRNALTYNASYTTNVSVD